MDNAPILLDVRGLGVAFTQYAGAFGQAGFDAVRDVSLTVRAGEIVAVVGASGSGKSLLAHAILGLLPYNARTRGQIDFMGAPLTPKRQKALRGRQMALVPQSVAYLDPLMRVGPQVRKGRRDPAARQAADEALGRYGLDAAVQGLYPFALSGGMARRVLIATAAMERPALVIADEPTPGLGRAVARRVLGHFHEMAQAGAGVMLITHDLGLALEVAARVVVLYAGVAVESARAADFAREETLRHPYTRALWRAMPEHGFVAPPAGQPGVQVAGDCPYAPHCPQYTALCAQGVPYIAARGGWVRCHRDWGNAP